MDFLSGTALILFFFFGLLKLFHEITLAVTMHCWLISILTKFGCNVILVQLVSGIDEESAKISSQHHED